jgi:hypothetical protein
MDHSRQLSWEKMKQTLLTDFARVQDGAKKIEEKIAEKAIEFGHAAREAFDKLGEWGYDVENKLKPEWQRFESDASHNWEKVKSAVKFGFQRGKGSSQPPVSKS